jgi:hypothetical protein
LSLTLLFIASAITVRNAWRDVRGGETAADR